MRPFDVIGRLYQLSYATHLTELKYEISTTGLEPATSRLHRL
jgi:hypothetical protein